MKRIFLFPLLFLLIACARKPSRGEMVASTVTAEESQVPSEISEEMPIKIEKVKVYIENTLSMYGYLPEKKIVNTNFRNAVNELLIASKGSYGKKNVELSLINNTTSVQVNIDNNLDNIDVKSLGGNYRTGRGSSDFDRLFKDLLEDWDEDELLVFIADFIYSPGKTDVITGLNHLRMNITDAFQKNKHSKSIAVNIFHLESDFHGPYYFDNDNKAVSGINQRPYYIFIIGSEENVKAYSDIIVPRIDNYDLKNDYQISPTVKQIKDYSALPFTLNIGQFESLDRGLNNSLVKSVTVKNSLSNKSNFELAVAINLKDIPVPPDYLMDIDNYYLSDNRLELIDIHRINNNRIELSDGTEEVIKSHDVQKAKNATHVFLVSFPSTYAGVIELSLKKKLPKWLEDVTIKDGEDDRDIEANILKQSQTFGFKYIVEGIKEAQIKQGLNDEYFQISIDVNQEKSTFGGGAILSVLLGIVIALIIIVVVKNKQRQ